MLSRVSAWSIQNLSLTRNDNIFAKVGELCVDVSPLTHTQTEQARNSVPALFDASSFFCLTGLP